MILSYVMTNTFSRMEISHSWCVDVRSSTPSLTVNSQVDGTLYCVHRYFFSRDSVYFSTRLAQLGIREHEALPIIISLGDVERKDFEAFLSVIYPEWVDKHFISFFGYRDEWNLPVISRSMASRTSSGNRSSIFPLVGVSLRSASSR